MSVKSNTIASASKNFFQWRSITTRLTVYYLLILVCSLWIMTGIGSHFLKRNLQLGSGQQQLSTATLMAAQIDQEISFLAKHVGSVASQIDSVLLENPASLRPFLDKNTQLQLFFNEGVFITDEKGRMVNSISTTARRVDTNFIDKRFFEVPQRSEESAIIEVAIDKNLGVPVIRVVAPLHGVDGKVKGALFGVMNLALPNFLSLLTTRHYGATGGYFLSSPKLRMIVAATDKARIMEKFPAVGINLDLDYFFSGGQGTRVIRNAIGVEVLASVVPLQTLGLLLSVSLPTTEAFALLNALQLRLFFSAMFLTILISVLTWWMLRRQLAGLGLASAAVIAQSKDLSVSHVLPVADNNEIGDLVGGFNHLLALLKERDTALSWSERRFRAIFDAEPECVKLVAKNGDLLEMNNAGLKMLEVTTIKEVRDRRLESFILPQYVPQFKQLLAQVIAGKAGSLEFEIVGLCGTRRWMESHADALKNEQDGTTMMLSVTRDVTQNKLAQAALIDSEMRWKFAIEGSGDGLWDWNLLENTVFFSDRWKEMLGYHGDEVDASIAKRNRMDRWDDHVHPDDLAQVTVQIQACLNGTTATYKSEHRLLCKDTSWKWVLARGIVVSRDEKGTPLRMIGTGSDITEQKQLQSSLQTSLKEKVLLLNEVHHRVKNNLQVINSLLNLESSRCHEPSFQSVLKTMQGRIRSMSLLHQSLYRSGIFASADLGAYLQELASQAFKAQVVTDGIVCLKLDLERVMVSMDQATPCGLLVNELITNCFAHAFQDGTEGEIRLGLRVLPNSNKVRLSVGDNGVGLPNDFAAKSENSLGMQLVKDLARQIGGSLEIKAGPAAHFIVEFVPDILQVHTNASAQSESRVLSV